MSKIVHTQYRALPSYTTKDGSEIRELMHPETHGNRSQSLAEARVHPGQETRLHLHHDTEELYHVTRGVGLMTLGDRQFDIAAGDTVAISPGTAHRVRNTGSDTLVILCCCSPAYRHEDTDLL
jgi:mannose-6-phosphate isomerase-like protein (cupin superfamily)